MDDLRRPSGFGRAPDFELDCRMHGGGAPALKAIMEEAGRLDAGQILAVRAAFMPSLLCGIMAGRGFRPWSEAAADGEWKIYFLKEPRRR